MSAIARGVLALLAELAVGAEIMLALEADKLEAEECSNNGAEKAAAADAIGAAVLTGGTSD